MKQVSRNVMLRGVTLVELLVYMTILSFVTIGVTQMVTQIQKANVQTINLADQFSNADLALRRVQVKLGDSDKVEVADLDGLNPKGCLRLKNFERYRRDAVYFDGRHQYLRGGNDPGRVININGGMSRTMSVWVRVDADHVGRSTVATWGNGATAEFGIEIADGQPELQFNCVRVYQQTKRNIADGGWHHIAVTYQDPGGKVIDSNSARLYIDGVPVRTSVYRCPGRFHNTIRTNEKALFIGNNRRDRQSGFKGLISDLRIWRRTLAASEIRSLVDREPFANETMNLHVRLALDNVTGTGIANSGDWRGASSIRAFNFGTPARVKQTIVDQTKYHSFCMIDEDNDGLHELWESETALTLPQRVSGSYQPSLAREGVRKSEDVFVPGADGFFQVVGDNPATAIANFAIGKGIAGQADLRQKTQSQPLASTRITRRLELCTINASIDRPADGAPDAPISSTLCQFDKAFIEIKDYIEGQHGRLNIKHVTWHGSGDVLTATNIPNVPTRVTATWYKKLGILKFSSDMKLDTKVWGRLMVNTLYLPSGRSSDATVTFNFGVGALPFFEGGQYRMYDFAERKIPQGPGLKPRSLDFSNALLEAQSNTRKFCGMRSYLATITSEAEQNHLGKVMKITGNGQWKSGWIGARTDHSRIFEWVDGPEAVQPFWKGNSVSGGPFDIPSNSFGKSHDKFEIDRQPSFDGNHLHMRMLTGTEPWKFRYTNWGGGKEADLPWFPATHSCDTGSPTRSTSKCEPVLTTPGHAVAIHGHQRRGGGWFTSHESLATCNEADAQSVCGYYREYDQVGKEADARIGAQVTLKMDRFREFCLTPDNATP